MIDEEELAEFRAWKKAKNKSELDEAFQILESSLACPGKRQFAPLMPSMAYRVLANAIIALYREVKS